MGWRLYNGRIVLIANSYVLKSLYLIIQEIPLHGIKQNPIQYGSDCMKKQKK
jgi:hypothetical protein